MDELTEALMGRKIVGVELTEESRSYNYGSTTPVGTLTLDDDTKVEFYGIEDCCSYWEITHLARVDNVITSVEFEDDQGEGDDEYDAPTYYNIFVLAGDERINIMKCEGGAGNYPYYATGYRFKVHRPSPEF